MAILALDDIRLELQELQLDFQQIGFADGTSLVLFFAEIDRLLKAVEVPERELEHRFRQLRLYELLRDVEDQCPLGIVHLVARNRRGVFGSVDAALPFSTAFEKVAHSQIEFGNGVNDIRVQVRRREYWHKEAIPVECWIRTKRSGQLLRLALIDSGAGRQQIGAVRQREVNSLIERDSLGP